MKFRDLFLPKIARSDPQVRIEAVKDTEDRAVLEGVVENDSDPKVREVARKRLQELTAES